MEEVKKIICTLLIPRDIYMELNSQIQELFVEDGSFYATDFPADAEEGTFLGEYLQAFCEVVLIMNNEKYEVTNESSLKTELFKLGQTEDSFCMLIDITYPDSDKVYHDALYFQEISQSLGKYCFKLLGDQKLFSTEK